MKKILLFITFFSTVFLTSKVFAQADIVGGEDADIQDYPYQVALGSSSGWGFYAYCGASIINEYWILTAAHCVAGESASNTSVRVGSDNDYAQGGEVYDAAQIISHENYGSGNNWDIALIELEDPISFNNTTQPVLLVCEQQVNLGVQDPGQMSWVTGWGNTEGTTNSSQLQVVGVPITTESNYWGGVEDDEIMAGYPDGGYDSCQGDSGGPMVVLAADGETYLQVGIVSWGSGCADPGYPGVYSRVSYFIDWICDKTNGAVCANQDPFCDGNAVYGCTDSSAENYNPEATINDGSCEYACDNSVDLSLQLDCYGEEISWEILNENGVVVSSVNAGTYPGGSTAETMEEGGSIQQEQICLSEGCYTFIITDSWGDGLDGGAEVSCVEQGFDWANLIPFTMTNEDGDLLFEETNPAFGDCQSGGDDGPCSASYDFCVTADAPIYGCTDSEADNYNPNANTNDGSCEYLGCTDQDYLEYDATANVDDGSCETLIVEGCTDSEADNYNPDANINDGSCEYSYSWVPCDNQGWFEGFESYDDSNIDPQSDWIGWDNANSGVAVTDDFSFIGGQSILVEQDDDLVYEFSDINSGSGDLIFYMFIPSDGNAGAYFNILHDYNAADSNWAFEVYFASSQSGESSYVSADSDVSFDAVYDQWIEVKNEIDIENNSISFYYNDVFIHSWTWSDGSAGESNVLGALNLFGYCAGAGCVGQAWYDNIELCGFDTSGIGIDDSNLTQNSYIYPNPNNGSFELFFKNDTKNVYVEVVDLLGKKVYSDVIENYKLETKYAVHIKQPAGTYILRLITDNYSEEKMMIIK